MHPSSAWRLLADFYPPATARDQVISSMHTEGSRALESASAARRSSAHCGAPQRRWRTGSLSVCSAFTWAVAHSWPPLRQPARPARRPRWRLARRSTFVLRTAVFALGAAEPVLALAALELRIDIARGQRRRREEAARQGVAAQGAKRDRQGRGFGSGSRRQRDTVETPNPHCTGAARSPRTRRNDSAMTAN